MASGHVFYHLAFAFLFIFLLRKVGIGFKQPRQIIHVQPQTIFSRTSNFCHCSCLALVCHLGSPRAIQRLVCIRFLGRRLLCCNGTSSFNRSVIKIALSGDIHPQPGPNSTALCGFLTARTVASQLNIFPKNAHLNIKCTLLEVQRELYFGQRYYSNIWLWYTYHIRNLAGFCGDWCLCLCTRIFTV